MARKGHTKSRNGCLECKRRHLKCGEETPVCKKCEFSERICTYDSPLAGRPRSNGSSQTSTPGTISMTDSSNAMYDRTLLAPITSEAPEYSADVNMDHLELLYNFQTETCQTVARTPSQIEQYRKLIMIHGLRNPYLMYQMLALSSLHMSLQQQQQQPSSSSSSKTQFYRTTASTLQNLAVTGFNATLSTVTSQNCLDVLLFQHMIALHVFCDIFNPSNSTTDNFNTFLDRLVGCIRLLRGVNSVIQTWWSHLSSTEIGFLITQSDELQQKPKGSLGECDGLKVMIDQADLSGNSIAVCHEALRKLQRYLDSENALLVDAVRQQETEGGAEDSELSSTSTNMIFAWLVTASSEFTDLLDQRRPEALVLLAYYAVLLHKRRRSWAIGDAGLRLLMHVNGYLGKRWENWLQWPNTVILGELGSSSSNVQL